MYLLPRIFGISTYIMLVIITSGLIVKLRVKNISKVLFLCNVTLGVMAYCYCMTSTDDLYRLLPIMHRVSNMDIDTLSSTIMEGRESVLFLFYWIVGIFHNDRLYPMVTSIISYTFFFRIIARSQQVWCAKKLDVALAFYLFMARGIYVAGITNIRTIIVVSVFSYIVFEEMIEKKSMFMHLPIYIGISLFHAAGMMMTIIRLGYYLIEKREFREHKVRYAMVLLLTTVIVSQYGMAYLIRFRDKMNEYLQSAADGTAYDYVFERIIGIICITICAGLIYEAVKVIRNKEGKSKKEFIHFCALVTGIDCVLFFFEYTSFYRLNWLVSILVAPIYIYVISNIEENKIHHIRKRVVILATCMFLIACMRGRLSNLKYFLSFTELL